MVGSQETELSDKLVIKGVIVRIKNIQQPGFVHNQDHVDDLVRFGFKPTDAVYQLTLKFNGGSKQHYATVEQLFEVAKPYDVDCPRRLVGKEVNVEINGKSIYAGFVEKIEPIIPVTD